MDFRVLGPLEVAEDGRTVPLGGAGQRTLLAALLVHANETVSVSRLTDALWAGRPPETATKIVQLYVSQLRKAIGAERLLTRPGGYLLELGPGELDAARFERLVEEARLAEPAAAAGLLREALGLWNGRAFADLDDAPLVREEAARLEELRVSVLEERIEADLALGRQASLIAELSSLVREHPLRERLHGQLMLALYRSGRQAEALEAYRRARAAFVDELGLEPSPLLQRLEQAILQHDAELAAPPIVEERSSAHARRPRAALGKPVLAAGAVLLAAAVAAAVVELTRGGAALTPVAPNSAAEIDPRSNRVVRSVPVGATPTSVAIGLGAVWVLNSNENTLSRIDPAAKDAPSRTIGGVVKPTGVAAGHGGVWVTTQSHRVSVVDPESDAVAQVLALPSAIREHLLMVGSDLPSAVAAGKTGVWATSLGYVSRIAGRPRDATITDRIRAPRTVSCCAAVALGDDLVWATDDRGVSRLDPVTREARHISLPFFSTSLAAGYGAVWLANDTADTVWRVDAQTGQVDWTVPVRRHPAGLAVGADSVWVASTDGTVSRIDPNNPRVTKTIDVGSTPRGIAVDDGAVWVTVD
jgi:YVTN family beta-propeller protein